MESSLELRYGSSSVEDGTRRENPEGIPGGRNTPSHGGRDGCVGLLLLSLLSEMADSK